MRSSSGAPSSFCVACCQLTRSPVSATTAVAVSAISSMADSTGLSAAPMRRVIAISPSTGWMPVQVSTCALFAPTLAKTSTGPRTWPLTSSANTRAPTLCVPAQVSAWCVLTVYLLPACTGIA